MVLQPSAETVYGLLNWLCPVLFGLHLYVRTGLGTKQYRSAITSTFLWGVLVLGCLRRLSISLPPAMGPVLAGKRDAMTGRRQFRPARAVADPGLEHHECSRAICKHDDGGLFFLFAVRSPLKLPAAIAGYTSFLLSIVRTAG